MKQGLCSYTGKAGKTYLAYTGDTGPTTLFWQKVSRLRADCLIVETSFPDSLADLALKTGHLTPSLLKNEILKMNNIPSRIYVSHSKPGYLKEIRKEIKALYVPNLEFLQDNQVVTVQQLWLDTLMGCAHGLFFYSQVW